MVCLAFSMMLLSCVEREEVTGLETESGYTIRGSVQYWGDEIAAAGVLVGLSGISKSETCITDSTGSFSFTDVEDGLIQYSRSRLRKSIATSYRRVRK